MGSRGREVEVLTHAQPNSDGGRSTNFAVRRVCWCSVTSQGRSYHGVAVSDVCEDPGGIDGDCFTLSSLIEDHRTTVSYSNH